MRVHSEPIRPEGGATLRLPEQGLPYLLLGDDLIEMETGDAKAQIDEAIYYAHGANSTARTRSARPVILAQSASLPKLAHKWELYRMEVKNGNRQLLFRVGQKRIAVPIPVIATPLSATLYQFTVGQDLAPGEYALSPSGSNQVFLFEIY